MKLRIKKYCKDTVELPASFDVNGDGYLTYPINLLYETYRKVLDENELEELAYELLNNPKKVKQLEDIISMLTQRENKILHLYYKDKLSLTDIGPILDNPVTCARVEYLKNRALRRLRHPYKLKLLMQSPVEYFGYDVL